MDIDKDETDELFFIVEKIINSRRVRDQVQYRVCWQGFEKESDIWELIEYLLDPDVMNLVISFHQEFPRKLVRRTLEDRLWTARFVVHWLLFEGTVSTILVRLLVNVYTFPYPIANPYFYSNGGMIRGIGKSPWVVFVRIIVLTPNWVTMSFLYRVSPMFLLLYLLVISFFYICAWYSLLYLFHTISAHITALSLYFSPIKLLLYFSYFLQDSLTRVRVTLMSITSCYH